MIYNTGSVINYQVASSSDFLKLRSDITAKIKGYLQKEETLPKLSELLATNIDIDGLEQHEIVCLAAMAENMDHPESAIWSLSD